LVNSANLFIILHPIVNFLTVHFEIQTVYSNADISKT
jgi:hypothetical protein